MPRITEHCCTDGTVHSVVTHKICIICLLRFSSSALRSNWQVTEKTQLTGCKKSTCFVTVTLMFKQTTWYPILITLCLVMRRYENCDLPSLLLGLNSLQQCFAWEERILWKLRGLMVKCVILPFSQKGNFARGFPREEMLNQRSTKHCKINNHRTGNEEV